LRVQVKLGGDLKEAVKEREITLRDIEEGSTFMDLIEIMIRKYGDAFSDIIEEEGRLNFSYLVIVNGRSLESPAMKLKNGDRVVIYPAIGGG